MGRRKKYETTFLIKLTERMLARLREHSKAKRIDVSQIIRMAVEKYLREENK